MDRLINVKVSGNFLTKDGNRAGVQGEGNVTTLRLTFDAGWDGLAKHLTWWDAYGEHPVKVILGADLLEDLAEDTRTYRVLIPPEPLAVDGWCSFVIDGYIDNQRQRTVEDKLKVLPANSAEDAPAPSDPTPSQAEQLQKQIDNLLGGMQEAARESKEAQTAIENMSVTAEHVPHDSDKPALERDVNDDGSVALHFNIRNPMNNVYVGEGEMPEGFNMQFDPTGEGYDLRDLTAEVLQEAKESGLFDGPKGDKGDKGEDGTMTFEELTEEQKESLRGDKGDKGDRGDPGVYVGSGEMPKDAYIQFDPNGVGVDLDKLIEEAVAAAMQNTTTARIGEVNLLASAWAGSGNLWSQVVQLDGVTERSQVDLTPSVEQLAIWYDKSLAFVAEQENSIVTVYAIGQKPTNDYTVQVTITEVNV